MEGVLILHSAHDIPGTKRFREIDWREFLERLIGERDQKMQIILHEGF